MKLTAALTTGIAVSIAALLFSGLSPATAETLTENTSISLPGAVPSDAGSDVDTVRLPNGQLVSFPGSAVTRAGEETHVTLPSGTELDIPNETAATRSNYPPITIMYSRSDVEDMWAAMNNINEICRWVPLPYLAGIGCGASASLADVISQAHYQQKRIKALYYECSSGSYCSYYTYSAVA